MNRKSDYINREDAKKWLTNLREDCGRYQDLWHYGEALEQIIESLDADVAPVKHAYWIHEHLPSTSGGTYAIVRCSECKRQFPMWETKYCPDCGARMDGTE